MNNIFLLGVAMDFGKMIKWIPTFIDGMIVTVVLSLMTVFLGSIIGLVATFLQQSQKKSLKAVANIYTQVIRGTPLLVQLYIWLYGLPLIGISLPTLPFLGDVYGSREFLQQLLLYRLIQVLTFVSYLGEDLSLLIKDKWRQGDLLG